jgi:hypothetical protein
VKANRYLKFNDRVPEHIQLALEEYIIHGYPPGSFVTAVLCNNLIKAACSCDYLNQQYLIDIAKWVFHAAPIGCWGDERTIARWVADTDQIRTNFVVPLQKQKMWEMLQQV